MFESYLPKFILKLKLNLGVACSLKSKVLQSVSRNAVAHYVPLLEFTLSSIGQSLDVQLDKLKHCDRIYQEKKSGTSGKRPQLKACLDYVRDGDTLVVTRLDRLARSTLHLCQIAADLEHKQVNLQVLDQNIDTGDATGRLLFNMLGAIGQFETEIRAERQMDGIQKAKERGVHFGRKRSLNVRQINELRDRRMQGVLIKTLMKDYGLSKASEYRYLGSTERT
jgi:DNA invertase Pin-like site-specific DNA recombinase